MRGCKGGMIMLDAVEVIGKSSVIQHGKHNNRVYLMKLDEQEVEQVLSEIQTIAKKNDYSKVFCKIPKHVAPLFFAEGYILEACIPKFYNQKSDVFFVSKFLDPDRLLNTESEQLESLYHLLLSEPVKKKSLNSHTSDYTVRRLDTSDVDQITIIYREVFETYPFPIHNSGYILKSMENNVQYFGAEKDGELAALSSAEIDFLGGNAEMTDFATLSSHTGNNLSSLLLGAMESEMRTQEITLLYTIARLNSIQMNKTFLRNDYLYSGTLIKNTNIAGNIESMNVYYKKV